MYQGWPLGSMLVCLPQAQLELLRTRIVAARDERRLGVRDFLHRVQRGRIALDLGRITSRADDEKVVVHDQQSLGAVALLHPLHLAGWRVDQHDVCFATRAECQRSAGSDADRLHLIARLLLEQRDEHVQQSAVLGAGRRRQNEVRVVARARHGGGLGGRDGAWRCDRRRACGGFGRWL